MIIGGASASCAARGLALALAVMIPNGSPEKRFSFRAVMLDCTGKRFSNRKGKRKHENKIVRRRACCERGHDCSSKSRGIPAAKGASTEAQLHAVPRRFSLRCGPVVFHRSGRRRCGHTAVDRFIQANAIPRLGCVRHHPPRTGRLFIRVEVRSRARVHTPWQLSRSSGLQPIRLSRHSPIAEIQLSHACGTSETPERSSRMETIYETRTICGMETICGTQTISEMETIRGTQTICEMETTICVVTGKNTFSLTAQGIGIAIGTAIATIGGMATDAPSLMDRG